MYGQNYNLHTGDIITSGVPAPEVPPQYQSLIDANPYRNAEFRVGPLQQLASFFGFRSKADAWRENMAVQANEYDSAILQKAYNEDYEDPTSQVARMRAAGLNPDLDPSSISSGEASPMPEDPSTPMQSVGDEEAMVTVASTVMQCFNSALGMVSSIQGIAHSSLANSALGIANQVSISELAKQLGPLFVPELPYSMQWDDKDQIQVPVYDWNHRAYESARLYAKISGLKKPDQKKFLKAINGYYDSALGRAESFEQFSKGVSQRREFYINDNTLNDMADEAMVLIGKEFGNMRESFARISAQTDISKVQAEGAEADYETKLYKGDDTHPGLDPFAQADAINQQNESSAHNFHMQKILNETLDNIVTGLEDLAKNAETSFGRYFYHGLMTLISVARLSVMNNLLPSIHTSSSTGSSGWSNGTGSASHSSSSFGIGW